MSDRTRAILVTGGTGYIGQALLPELISRGHRVRALVRPGSEGRLATGVEPVVGNALVVDDVARALPGANMLVHLVGVSRPGPRKAALFRQVDFPSIRASVLAAAAASPRPHIVYLSVAQPANVMKEYVAVRAEGEALIRRHGLDATFVRPWYVLGPGHRWPVVLLPVYALMRRLPQTRESSERLGLVTLTQMIAALVQAIEDPVTGVRIFDVPAIRSAGH